MLREIRTLGLSFVAATVAVLLVPTETSAQGRDRLLNLLRDELLRQELELSPEQQSQLEALQNQQLSGGDLFDQYAERLRNAATNEEVDAIRAEMDAAAEKARDDADTAAHDLLTAGQHDRLAGSIIRRRGAWALTNPSVQKSLGLTPEQIASLEELQEQRHTVASELDSEATPDQYREFRDEWSDKPLTVLNSEQQEKYKIVSAPPADAEETTSDRPSSPAEVAQEAPPAEQPEERTMAEQRPVDEPPADPASIDDPAYEWEEDDDGPIVSFGTSGEGSRAANDQEQRTLSFNFRYAPWSEVLRLFADYSNLTLDLNQVPPGTFNYYDNRKYTPTEALDVLNGYLIQKGYILVRRDNFLVCLNIDDGIPPNLVPNITPEELPQRGQNELLNVVFPIEGVSATDVAREVELLLGPQGKVVPLGTSNSLVVTDIGSNLRRIGRLLDAVAAAGPGDLVFKSYPLTYLDPRDAETIVKTQLGLEAGVRSVSSAYDDWRRDRDRDRDRNRDRNGDSGSRRTETTKEETTPRVAADDRTNGLLITATAAQHRIVESVLEATDVPSAAADRARARSNEPYLQVYRLRRSDPREVVKTVDVLMPGVVVNEDRRARKIHVHAPPAVHEEVQELIALLDGDGASGGSAVSVIPLATLDPYGAASTIRALFAADDDDAPVIEADSSGRRLLIRGTQEQVTQIRALLSQLGEDGTGRSNGHYSSGRVRMIPLGGRDPQEVIPLLQRLWQTSGDAPLQIVPTPSGSIIERRPFGEPEARNDSGPAANFNILDPVSPNSEADSSATEPSEAAGSDGATAVESELPAEEAPKPESITPTFVEPIDRSLESDSTAMQGESESDSELPIAVTVQGGNLVIASEDEEALNRLEDLMARLGQVVPPRTKWNVFYLQSADATETAMLLEQLFPMSSVSSAPLDSSLFSGLTGRISSFGGNLMDATGLDGLGAETQTLRIIPDIRSNSLFVSGPLNKVDEVEQVLTVLDTSELPDSLRDRVPRMIEVEYADVNEVADILREVYKDYLEPSNMAAMGGNPLAMLLAASGGGGGRGGRGRGDRDQREEPVGSIRMTIGVDAQTSRLIVSADDPLFRQVEELVQSLDESAREANHSVQVITLENANASMLQSSLDSLIPRVRTSSTAERRDTSNWRSSRSDSRRSFRRGR